MDDLFFFLLFGRNERVYISVVVKRRDHSVVPNRGVLCCRRSGPPKTVVSKHESRRPHVVVNLRGFR